MENSSSVPEWGQSPASDCGPPAERSYHIADFDAYQDLRPPLGPCTLSSLACPFLFFLFFFFFFFFFLLFNCSYCTKRRRIWPKVECASPGTVLWKRLSM
jgi:hypothetical protein